jgi:hypothetical protein
MPLHEERSLQHKGNLLSNLINSKYRPRNIYEDYII